MDQEWQLWRAQLAADDQLLLDRLLANLQAAGGELSALPADDLRSLQALARRYADLPAPVAPKRQLPVEPQDDADAVDTPASAPRLQANAAILRDALILQVIEILRRDLCSGGVSLADAVIYAYGQKWVADELRTPEGCAQFYARFQREIDSINAGRIAVEGEAAVRADKMKAVGIAWFASIFRLQKLLADGVDLDS